MRIFVACPAPPRSLKGNRVTAARWTMLLRSLGHDVTLGQDWQGQPADLMIALHARKSHPAIKSYRHHSPGGRLMVCLTGTDVYHDLPTSKLAWQSLEWADRVVVLQPKATEALPRRMHGKVLVVWQSASPVAHPRRARMRRAFRICVLGHLRAEKDPLRAGLALKHLANDRALRVVQAGEALTPTYARQALALMRREPRYRWLGAIPRWRARRLLARSDALVISSRLEGGANVVSEAIVQRVPVLASDIPGNLGMLGDDYPGYFPVGNTQGLADLMRRANCDVGFYQRLKTWIDGLADRFTPERERETWQRLLRELTHAAQD